MEEGKDGRNEPDGRNMRDGKKVMNGRKVRDGRNWGGILFRGRVKAKYLTS